MSFMLNQSVANYGCNKFVDVSDIDECLNATHSCNLNTTECVNEPGTFSCSCLPGFYAPTGSLYCNGI